MLVEKNPELGVAYDQLKRVSADEEKRAEYIRREKEIRDQIAYLEEATRKGIEQGIEQKALEVAENLLKIGLPVEKIAEATELPIDVVMQLENEMR